MSRNVSLVLVLTIMSVCAAKQLSVEEAVSSESLEEDRSSIILYRLRELISSILVSGW